MVNCCSAFNCSSSNDVRKDLSFQKFPLKEKERLQKWVHAVRRKDFKPSSSSTLCSLHFKETDFNLAVVSGKLMLKKCAVPTVFNFPDHLMPKIKERRILQREYNCGFNLFFTDTTTQVHISENTSTDETETRFLDVGTQTNLTGEELERTLQDLRRDKRILQQKLMRRDKRIITLSTMSAPAKKRAVQPSERKGNASDDQEDKTDEMVINVEFEGRNPENSDFHGIKQLLQQLFLKAQVNLSEMASYLIQQQGIGSVIKQVLNDDDDDDDDDDDEVDANQVFGITTVFSLTEQDSESVEQLNKLLLTLGKEHCDETTFKFIGKLLNEKKIPVALLINERYVNIPPPISVPLFQSISKEMSKVGLKKCPKDDSAYFIMICKLYKLKHRNKGNKKNETEIIWSNAEEELFDEEAEYKFEFCVQNEKGSGLAGSWETDDDEMIPYRRVLFFPAQKLDFIVSKIQSLLYGV